MINRKPTISDKYDFERSISKKNRRLAFYRGRALRSSPCKNCKGFLCTCQSTLSEFEKKKPIILKNKCSNCGLYLCDCPVDATGKPI